MGRDSPPREAKQPAAGLTLVRYRDEDGRELSTCRTRRCPIPGTPAPVRFLPHWDANLLVHARRTGILPEPYRPRVFSTRNPFSVGTLPGRRVVAGAWSLKDGRIVLDPFEELTRGIAAPSSGEREALEAFHA